MLPSTSSNFTLHHAAQRPPSRGSQRPSEVTRPSSRTSLRQTNRPPSSLSNRPLSSASIRPQSRLSQRPNSRHARSARLLPLCQKLVTQITGFQVDDDDAENFSASVDFVFRNLESTTLNKGAASVDMNLMDKQVLGHVEKARVHSRDAMAKALELAYKRLKSSFAQNTDLDDEIKLTHLPDHLNLLISLACPPDSSTLSFADDYLESASHPPVQPAQLTWQDILKEEPFEGQHWEGAYGLQPGSVVNGHTSQSEDDEDSLQSLSPLNSDDLALDLEDDSLSSIDEPAEPGIPLEYTSVPPIEPVTEEVNHLTAALARRRLLEALSTRQYWRSDWVIDPGIFQQPFNISDPSTFGPAIQRVLAREKGRHSAIAIDPPQVSKYINEEDAVREVLIALQGRENIMLGWTRDAFVPKERCPKLIHLSAASQDSIISSLGLTASIVQRLRQLVSLLLDQPLSTSHRPHTLNTNNSRRVRITRTLEAFADAIDREIRGFDSWCAAREEDICRAQAGAASEPELVVSLLSTEKAVNDQFGGAFAALFAVIRTVIPYDEVAVIDTATVEATWIIPGSSPAATTAHLLDALFEAVHQHAERGDQASTALLTRLFACTVEPVWAMIGRWLLDGMGLGAGQGERPLDNEFFIEGSGLTVGFNGQRTALFDPEFWEEGYTLRDSAGDKKAGVIPAFLKHVADPVLSAGKAKGLLRALGVPQGDEEALLCQWRSFSDLLMSEAHDQSGLPRSASMELDTVSVDTLSRVVYDELAPHCEATGRILAKVIVQDCELWVHLSAIEGVYLMRRGDTMSHFCDVLFAKMDSRHLWADFHTLNTAFNDVVQMNTALGNEWIQASLVRLSYRSRSKDMKINETVRAIDGLAVEYAVPFPLTYIFPPKVLEAYGKIFVLLLQIRRAKTVLEKILVRGESLRAARLQNELKILYAMRSRLAWFINALLNFLTTHVIHTQVLRFRAEIAQAKSLDDMIRLHYEHIERLQGRCLLQDDTSALHGAILSILDMALHFSENFVSFAGDTSMHDISRRSISGTTRRHRSRRQRRQSRNVIGFELPPRETLESSDSEESDHGSENPMAAPETTFSMAGSSAMSSEDDFHGRFEKMSADLDDLVRFIRRGVESLAGGIGEAAPSFGIFAFTLEDWDS
ncbi:hypothetical protein HGRIS_010085 [Hohenbuehelia grisea]|uniref:Spindle pole body component n=1 Tax=Hohenbuehelia grisea TaxID=104357 RepID=A0ABR3J382_9AGAR